MTNLYTPETLQNSYDMGMYIPANSLMAAYGDSARYSLNASDLLKSMNDNGFRGILNTANPAIFAQETMVARANKGYCSSQYESEIAANRAINRASKILDNHPALAAICLVEDEARLSSEVFDRLLDNISETHLLFGLSGLAVNSIVEYRNENPVDYETIVAFNFD